MAAQWFVMFGGSRRGPFPAETLQRMVDNGEVAPDDLVWCDGMADWVKARTVIKPSDYRAARSRRERDDYAGRRVDDYDRRDDHRRDDPRLDKPTGPPPQFPGRLITPGFFLVALLLFFCPWVDVNCAGNTVVSQSGLQLGYGGYSTSYWFEMEMRNRGRAVPPNLLQVKAAPLMFVVAGLVVAGLVLGLALPTGLARILSTAIPAALVLVLMILQTSMGFPIKENVDRANRDEPELRDFRGMPFPAGRPFVPGQALTVGTTPWFWLAFVFTLGVGGGLLIEHLAIFTTPRRQTLFDADDG